MQTIYNESSKTVTTKYALGERKERHGEKIGVLILTINTRKGYNGGIATDAEVSLHFQGYSQHVFSFNGDPNNDFRKTLVETPAKRVTKNLLIACHSESQICFNAVLSQALTHYNISHEEYLTYNVNNVKTA